MNKPISFVFTAIFSVSAFISARADLSPASPTKTKAKVSGAEPFTPVIPKVWDDAIMPTLELPSVEPAYTPQQIKADSQLSKTAE